MFLKIFQVNLSLYYYFRFGTSWALKRHVSAVHLKILSSVCRYEGCNAAYCDSGSRSNHERMQHGAVFSIAVKKGLVPPPPPRSEESNESQNM